jgi:hypothetical protein
MSKQPALLDEVKRSGNDRPPHYAPNKFRTSAVCPSCGVRAQFELGHSSKFVAQEDGASATLYINNAVTVAKCEACKRAAIFFLGRQIHPPSSGAVPRPHADMPESVRPDYQEASDILDLSPRAAAALLRLAVEKLCPELGATESDLNASIAELFASGKISSQLKEALDTLRVIGNECVHPGQIDLNDNRDPALALFNVMNFIIERAISEPQKIKEIYGMLPPEKVKGIEDRDKAALKAYSSDGAVAVELPRAAPESDHFDPADS